MGVAIVIVVINIAAALLRVWQKQKALDPSLTIDGRIVALALRGLSVGLVRPLLVLFAAGVLLARGPLWLALLAFTCGYPAPFIRWVAVPSGLPYLPYLATRAFRPRSARAEVVAYALFNELRARLRHGPRLPSWLAEKLEVADVAGGITVTVLAMLDALRGELEPARALFRLSSGMKHSMPSAQHYSQAWLLADAASRADYREVVKIARRGPATRRSDFVCAAAERLLGSGRPCSNARLRWLWFLAPGKLAHRQLLRLALAAHPLAKPELDDTPGVEPGFLAARQALLRLQLCRPGTTTRRQVVGVAEAWDRVIEDKAHVEWLRERASGLQATCDIEATAMALEQDAVALLSQLWLGARDDGDAVASESELMLRVADEIEAKICDQVGEWVDVLPVDYDSWLRWSKRREPDVGPRHMEEFWRHWAEIRQLGERYLDLFPEHGELLHDRFGADLHNHAVWLHNNRRAYALAHDIFDWLLAIVPEGSDSELLLETNRRLSQDAARL